MKTVMLFILALLIAFAPVAGFCGSNDLGSQLDVVNVLAPGLYTTDQTSAAIDGRNYQAHLFGFYVSAGSYTADLGIEFNLTHSATSGGTYTAVTDSDLIGVTTNASGTVYAVNEDISTAAYHEVTYIGRMPYLKVTMDMIGNHATATPTVSIIDVKGRKIIGD